MESCRATTALLSNTLVTLPLKIEPEIFSTMPTSGQHGDKKLHCAGRLLAMFTVQLLKWSEFFQFWFKGGTSGGASRDINSSWWLILWCLLLSAKEMHRKAQKHMECSYTVVILLSRVFGTETHWFSTRHSTVAAHIWLDIVYIGRWEGAELVPCQLALSKRAGPARQGSARHDVGTLWSCLHCHC